MPCCCSAFNHVKATPVFVPSVCCLHLYVVCATCLTCMSWQLHVIDWPSNAILAMRSSHRASFAPRRSQALTAEHLSSGCMAFPARPWETDSLLLLGASSYPPQADRKACLTAVPALQPEMSSNVQHHPKEVYLRTSEAVQCRVQSTILVPIFLDPLRESIVGALEVVQTAEDMPFDFVISSLAEIMPVSAHAGLAHSHQMRGVPPCLQPGVKGGSPAGPHDTPRTSCSRDVRDCLPRCSMLSLRHSEGAGHVGMSLVRCDLLPTHGRMDPPGCGDPLKLECLQAPPTASHSLHKPQRVAHTRTKSDAAFARAPSNTVPAGVWAVHQQPARQPLQGHGRVVRHCAGHCTPQ